MLRNILLSVAFVATTVVSAHALEAPANVEACQKMIDDMTQTADPAKLPDEALGKLDELMNTAEKQCEAGQFAEVVQTAEAIQSALTATAKN